MNILLIQDEDGSRLSLRGILEDAFPELTLLTASDGERALQLLRGGEIHLVVAALLLPERDGEGLLEAIRSENPLIPVVVVSIHGTVDPSVSLLQDGVRDGIARPSWQGDLVLRVALALETLRLRQELSTVRLALRHACGDERILTSSPSMEALIRRMKAVARSNAPVLVTGESGTGKGLIARELHLLSERRERAFVAINCRAFPESLLETELFGCRKSALSRAPRDRTGAIEQAASGTLFLDEIDETRLSLQARLLRFLQDGEVRAQGEGHTTHGDVRVVAATNRDLRVMADQGKFRADLLCCLQGISLHVPPLRERREDILLLAQVFLARYSREAEGMRTLSPSARQKLLGYSWPGNVRELENKMRLLSILATQEAILQDEIVLEAASDPVGLPAESAPFKEARREVVDRFERSYLEALLTRHHGSSSRASEEAGLDRKNLWRLLKKHGIEAAVFRT